MTAENVRSMVFGALSPGFIVGLMLGLYLGMLAA